MVGMVLLIISSTLSAFLPNKEKVLSETLLAEDDKLNLSRDLTRINSELDSLSKIKFNTINKIDSLLKEARITGIEYSIDSIVTDSTLSIISDDLSSIIIDIEKEIQETKIQLEKLSNSFNIQRNQFVDEYFAASKDFILTRTNWQDQLTQIPLFYSVSKKGFYDFGELRYVKINEVIEKHKGIKLVSYPFFIIEPDGRNLWNGNLREIEKQCIASDMKFGYEPYERTKNVIYDFFKVNIPKSK